MATLSLPVHSYKLRSTPASPAQLLNAYAEALPLDAKTRLILCRAPGIEPHSTPGNGPIRGMHQAFGSLYVVSGNELYRVQSDGTETLLGSVTSGNVSMAHNIDSIVVVTEPDAFYSDGISTFTQITDVDFTARGARYVAFVDNWMLFTEPGTGRFFGADLGTVSDYDSLNFATAEGQPDDVIGMIVDHRQVVLLGEESGEIWENTGISGFPFERSINGFFEIGCFNGNTVAKIDNSILWLANDYTVRKLSGATPQRVSTHAIEQFLTTVDVTTGRAYSYSQDGHFFYVLSFQEGCKVYDATTGEWHDRASYPNDYYRWQYGCEAFGRQLVGDAFSNAIGAFSPLVYDENGDTQRMAWVYQTVYGENGMAFHDELEVILEAGVGLVTGQGSDPEMMMDYSDDGGQTWVSLPNKKIGRIGERHVRPRWNALGASRQRVYRGAVSDPVKVVISDTQIRVRGGRL